MEERFSTCVFCDGGCAVKVGIAENGKMSSVAPANPLVPAICSKANMIEDYRLHPDRIVKPLRRKGKRGAGAWEEITWDEALDEIAAKLRAVIDKYGPEAFAVAEMPLNTGFGGITRRFMNYLGSPNYTAPVELCMGNTAQVHRAVYGWYSLSNWEKADCIVYFGQDRDEERWPGEFVNLKAALLRGAKLIDVDPRVTKTAKLADYHLRIRYGSDTALALAWINTIITEDLYDHEFVRQHCMGFDDLAKRVREWTPERAAEICGVDAGLIRETAHLYANAQAAIIPWGVVGDMQVNSTSFLQCQCILRAICGYIGKSETVFGPSVGGVTNSELAAFEVLPQEQRDKQLGQQSHPLLTFRASDKYCEANARFNISYEPDILGESCACVPAALFAAMRGEGPYPVKAIFSIANNTIMSYANQQGIIEAFMNQDLVVAFENWMVPTAQLADYVLPGDMWAERDVLGSALDVAPMFVANEAFYKRVGECRNWYSVLRDLAVRMGLEKAFPWKDEYELYDWRLAPLGITFEELKKTHMAANNPVAFGQFVTPTGKIELKSSVLEDLGFDPLPAYTEPQDPGAEAAGAGNYPYVIFAGCRERCFYNTNLRQIPRLRKRAPEPLLFINPLDAQNEGIEENMWCAIKTPYGQVELMAHLDEAQPVGTLRIPHGWWKPETTQGLAGNLSGANLYNDGMLFPDEPWNLDPVQGVANLRGGIHACIITHNPQIR